MSKILFFFEDVEKINIDYNLLEGLTGSLIADENKKKGKLSVIFCSDEYLLKINQEYLGHNYYTDIITFDYCEKSLVSGDLFISVDRVADNALKFGTTFINELYRVIIHGVLHLVGYDDKNDALKETMTEKEDYYLRKMNFDRKEV